MPQFVKLTTPELKDMLINMEKVVSIRMGETAKQVGMIHIQYETGQHHRLIYPQDRYSTYTDSVAELLDFYHEKKGNRDPTEKIRALLDKRQYTV